MTTPNFFIVGAPKAGTDALYYELDQHPEIYMSPLKEPCYFSSEIRLEDFDPFLQPRMQLVSERMQRYLDAGLPGKFFGGFIADSNDYLKLFSRVKNEKAIGEGSVCYLWSRSAPFAIASAIPKARIIIILMDPAERAFHQYLNSVSDGTVGHSFREHLEHARQAGSQLGIYHPFLDFGDYAEQVDRYMKLFPPEQLSISLYEDLQEDYDGWFSNLLSFLKVDNTFVPPKIKVPSEPRIPRFVGVSYALHLGELRRAVSGFCPPGLKTFGKKLIYDDGAVPHLDAEDRARLVAYYRENILRLEDLIGRDLSAWLQ